MSLIWKKLIKIEKSNSKWFSKFTASSLSKYLSSISSANIEMYISICLEYNLRIKFVNAFSN